MIANPSVAASRLPTAPPEAAPPADIEANLSAGARRDTW
jgi:hypothetical protein